MRQHFSLLPDDLPLNSGQKLWLSGFMAGLEQACVVLRENQQQENDTLKPLYILYGSQTGNAEALAYQCAEQAQNYGMAAEVCDMSALSAEDLPAMERLLLITSTYGEGEMPDNAQVLWAETAEDSAAQLTKVYFAVLALGDSGYDDFCEAGKLWDARLEALGGQRIAARVDCDTDYDTPAQQWFAQVLPIISSKGSQGQGNNQKLSTQISAKAAPVSPYNRNNPLSARLKHKRLLSGATSGKQIFHYEIDLADSGEQYDAGDVIHIFPVNRPELIAQLLPLIKAKPDEKVTWQGEEYLLAQLLTEKTEIRTPSRDFFAAFIPATNDTRLQELFSQTQRSGWEAFIYGKDIVDLLRAYPQAEFNAQTFVDTLKPLSARAYSISSSIHKNPGEVHITVGAVRYQLEDRVHHGVASTWLADMLEEGDLLRCYFAVNKHFSIPENGDTPIIMVGPGTGIAPFRAFLQEREALGACGDNWLFFGDRTRKDDFIYEAELQAMQDSGLLTRLDLAFSREQSEKIYVQDKMREYGAELFLWLERGAHFYVCGDALRMAKDVDKALHEIVAVHGNMDSAAAEKYVNALKKAKRYVRDVY